jgi:hypothetical protein
MLEVECLTPELSHCVEVVAVDEHAVDGERHRVIVAAKPFGRDRSFGAALFRVAFRSEPAQNVNELGSTAPAPDRRDCERSGAQYQLVVMTLL